MVKTTKETQISYIRSKNGASPQTPQALKGLQGNLFKYEGLYSNKFCILDEMDEFCERHKLPNLAQEEKENLESLYLRKKLNYG